MKIKVPPPYIGTATHILDSITDQEGAQWLCKTIMEKWRAAGYPDVLAVVHEERRERRYWNSNTGQMESRVIYTYEVRSNLINGLPSSVFQARAA